MKLCLATNNAHKVDEVKALLGDKFEILSLKDIGFTGDLSEDYDTMEENSAQKASYIFENFNVNCFADDSGLEVFALGNQPGVKSARYAGEQRSDSDNIDLLLKNLKGNTNRNARFRTVITLTLFGKIHQFEGIVEGEMTEERIGSSGFGYDPVFIPKGYNRTFASMPLEEKNKISHRGKAVEKLVTFLKEAVPAN